MPSKVTILKIKYRDFLDERQAWQACVDRGEPPGYPGETAALREAEWQVSRTAADSPGVCLAGLESYREARVWAERLRRDDAAVSSGLAVRVDSLHAALELDEIVHELRDVVTTLHCDHDGFLFGFIRTFHRYPEYVLPDRADLSAETHFLRAFSRRVAEIGRRRGVAVTGDVEETTGDSAHRIEAADLLLVPRGRITERGLRENLRIALRFLSREADGASLAEVTAAELARAQLWQWVRHETGVLDEGRIVTAELFRALLTEVAADIGGDTVLAAGRLADIVLRESFTMHAFCESDA